MSPKYYLIKGIVCLIAGFIYFRYFNRPIRMNKKNEDELKDQGYSKSLIQDIKWYDKVDTLKGWFGGTLLIFIGILLIYADLKKYF